MAKKVMKQCLDRCEGCGKTEKEAELRFWTDATGNMRFACAECAMLLAKESGIGMVFIPIEEMHFKKIAEELNWERAEMGHKFVKTLIALKLQGVSKMKVWNKEGKLIRNDDLLGEEPRIEVDYQNCIIRIKNLNKEITEICSNIISKPYNLNLAESCNRCGHNTFGSPYDGLCMDCADELGISEMFVTDADYEKSIEKAKMFLNTFQKKIGSASFKAE